MAVWDVGVLLSQISLTDPVTWLRLPLDLVTGLIGAGHPNTSRRPQSVPPAACGADPRRERDARAAIDKLAGPIWQVALRCTR